MEILNNEPEQEQEETEILTLTDENGKVLKEGAQVVLGANDKYIGLCRRHWRAGDLGPNFNGKGTGD